MADPRPDRPDRIDIRTAVEGGHLPALLAALRCLTGDPTLTAAALRPQVTGLASADHGLTPDQRAEAVRLATDRLVAWFAQGCPPGAAADEATLRDLLEFCAGNDSEDPPTGPGDRYMPLLRQELGLDGSDVRAPGWTADELAPGREFRVAIIGAGFSGLAMAHRCRQAGIEFVVLEKNPDVGGTWAENTYPGCRVDVPSHLYTFTFAPRDDWPHVYSTQPDIYSYLRDTAINLGITPHIRFRTEVTQARWDEQASTWTLDLATPNGPESLTAHALVSAVGQLNRPNIPDIPGADTFRGPAFHSARWDHRVDLNGARIAVIGTGASAAQLVPEIARNAGHVSVFQRTPAWFIPGPDYRHATPDAQHWLYAQVPGYSRWYRFLLFRWYVDGLMPFAQVDRDWDDGGRSISALNNKLRATLTRHLRAAVGDDGQLFAALVPGYPVTAKRMIRDDGAWVRTLRQDTVDLITTSIDHITADGIVTADGTLHQADVLVWSTGFRAADFLMPMRVIGRNERDLHRHWDGDARAYLGITVPGFPNLFCLYGPNTNIVLNGSVIWLSECEVDYTISALELLLRGRHDALDCRPETHDTYNSAIDRLNNEMAWGASTVNSWYRNAHGRISQNWPGTLLQFWEQTRRVNAGDYHLLTSRSADTDGAA